MTLFKNKYRIESARLKAWDYRNPGYYFVTICTYRRSAYFGEVEGEDMRLSVIGEIAARCWVEIRKHHQGIDLDEWVIMPNHVHGILVLTGKMQNPVSEAARNQLAEISPKTGSLSVAVRSFKSAVSKFAHEAGCEFDWQERFWDHIVRDEEELNRIRNYVRTNPANWENDLNNDDGLWM